MFQPAAAAAAALAAIDDGEPVVPDLHSERINDDEAFVIDPKFEFEAPQYVDLMVEMRRMFVGDDDADSQRDDAWFSERHVHHEAVVSADPAASGRPVVEIAKPSGKVSDDNSSIQELLDQHNKKIRENHNVAVRSRRDLAGGRPAAAVTRKRSSVVSTDPAKLRKRIRVEAVVCEAPRPLARMDPQSKASPTKKRKARPAATGKENVVGDAVVPKMKKGRNVANGKEDVDDIAAMLEAHNKQFRPKTKYVPRQHSTRDIRQWEQASGRRWYSLTPAEREDVNRRIAAEKAAATAQTSDRQRREMLTLRTSR
ncbi:Uncharacterized protein PBTT_00158 [Plasmodiophora brassicae]